MVVVIRVNVIAILDILVKIVVSKLLAHVMLRQIKFAQDVVLVMLEPVCVNQVGLVTLVHICYLVLAMELVQVRVCALILYAIAMQVLKVKLAIKLNHV